MHLRNVYSKGIPEQEVRRLHPYSVKIARKPNSPLKSNLIQVMDPDPTQQRRKVIYRGYGWNNTGHQGHPAIYPLISSDYFCNFVLIVIFQLIGKDRTALGANHNKFNN